MADELNQRLDRIETVLAEMRGTLATKADLAELRAEAKADLAALRDQLRIELATKDDLAEAVASITDTLAVYAAAVNGMTTIMQAFGHSRDRLARRLDAHARRLSALEASRRGS